MYAVNLDQIAGLGSSGAQLRMVGRVAGQSVFNGRPVVAVAFGGDFRLPAKDRKGDPGYVLIQGFHLFDLLVGEQVYGEFKMDFRALEGGKETTGKLFQTMSISF